MVVIMKKTFIHTSLLLLSISYSAFAYDLEYPTEPTFKMTSKGSLLVGKDNLALYTFKKDVNSPIPPKCTSMKDKGLLGSCLARWPAAIVTMEEMKTLILQDPKFGAVYNNELNKLQLTYSGLPVYYWFKDTNKNNFTGDGVGNSWSLILKDMPPTMFNGLATITR
ncbi:hypothetical protein CTN07_20105 [Photobacterium damselae]|uniref:Secreted repeat of uncharacterized function n=2 Tax=Photobacterium damselae TaxID=38293 RepID=A0A2T3Q8J0_PHODM|nr:hypothetical protein CTN07_20105 [Photobacterium damselae]SPY46020.1 Secreted repeat of uncharacterised function [Photobacterium damselae]